MSEFPPFPLELPPPCHRSWALARELVRQNRISSFEAKILTDGIWPTVPGGPEGSMVAPVALFILSDTPIPASQRRAG